MTILELSKIQKSFSKGINILEGISFKVEKGEIVSLLGPSGCGKTTTLRIIAGFENPTSGSLILGGEEISARGKSIPPHERKIGMVFQDYALFPHLTVGENIRFGLNKKDDQERILKDMLELVGMTGMEKRYPHELSGGQQQRVALARALAPSPEILLMDEPFSNLDAELKYIMRFEVQRILKKANISTVFVTHDQKDALAISDQMIVLNNGKVEQKGKPFEVYKNPQTPFVAKFISRANMIKATKVKDTIKTELGEFKLANELEGTGFLIIPRDQIQFDENGPLEAIVKYVAFEGEYYEITLSYKNTTLIAFLKGELGNTPKQGQTIRFRLNHYHFVRE